VADSKVHTVPVSKGTVVRWRVEVLHQQTIELSIYFRAKDPSAAVPEQAVVDVLHCEQAHHKVGVGVCLYAAHTRRSPLVPA
jgi:hypothetical protein